MKGEEDVGSCRGVKEPRAGEGAPHAPLASAAEVSYCGEVPRISSTIETYG